MKAFARTHEELNSENRLDVTLELLNHVINQHPITAEFEVSRGVGGNWDDLAIQAYRPKRIGLDYA